MEHRAVRRRAAGDAMVGEREDYPVWLWQRQECDLVLPHHELLGENGRDCELHLSKAFLFFQAGQHDMGPLEKAFLQAHQKYLKRSRAPGCPGYGGTRIESSGGQR